MTKPLGQELRQLRAELAEKERELATKARLLSERDRQLGQLREQLDMEDSCSRAFGRPGSRLAALSVPVLTTTFHFCTAMQLPTLLTRTRRETTPPAEEALKDPVEPEAEAAAAEDDAVGTNLLGRAVRSLVKNFDAKALGVKVDIGDIEIDALHGKIAVDNVVVTNPEGYYSEYLLRSGKMIVEVSLPVLLKSAGKTVEVKEVDLQDVDVIYETGLTTKLQSLNPAFQEKADKSSNSQEVILHKVSILNFGAKAASTLTHGLGPRFVMGDVVYQDFEKEMNPGRGIVDILQSLLFTAMGTCTARDKKPKYYQKFTRSLSSLATAASESASSTVQGLQSMASSVQGRLSSSSDPAQSPWAWLAPCQICEKPQTTNEIVATRVKVDGFQRARHGADTSGGLPVRRLGWDLVSPWILGRLSEALTAFPSLEATEKTRSVFVDRSSEGSQGRLSAASRAEDIPCLRHSSFVTRQQNLVAEEVEGTYTRGGETQEEHPLR
eukprot:s3449_g6.t1